MSLGQWSQPEDAEARAEMTRGRGYCNDLHRASVVSATNTNILRTLGLALGWTFGPETRAIQYQFSPQASYWLLSPQFSIRCTLPRLSALPNGEPPLISYHHVLHFYGNHLMCFTAIFYSSNLFQLRARHPGFITDGFHSSSFHSSSTSAKHTLTV